MKHPYTVKVHCTGITVVYRESRTLLAALTSERKEIPSMTMLNGTCVNSPEFAGNSAMRMRNDTCVKYRNTM